MCADVKGEPAVGIIVATTLWLLSPVKDRRLLYKTTAVAAATASVAMASALSPCVFIWDICGPALDKKRPYITD